MLYLQQTNPKTGTRTFQHIRNLFEGIKKSRYQATATIHEVPRESARASKSLIQACEEAPGKQVQDLMRRLVRGLAKKEGKDG